MKRSLLLFLFALSTAWRVSAATFTFTHYGTPPEAQAAIQHAADIWGGILVSDIPIKVAVSWTPLGTSALGVTFPNGRKDFPNAPYDSTWYATALANSIAQAELNPGEDDINVYLNSSTNWYYGTDGATPAGQYDLVSIALHELGHGLGFVGLAKKTGAEGSFGLLLASDFAPLITTFPWPQQDTLPGIFDRFLSNASNSPLMQLENPGVALGQALTSGQVYFSGSNAIAANNGGAARIYAPSVFALGSSCVHFNEATYPTGNANELMTPFSGAGVANHWPGPVCLGVMRDIGWVLSPEVGMPERAQLSHILVHPNPVRDRLTIHVKGTRTVDVLTVRDVSGRVCLTLLSGASADVSSLAPGMYSVSGTYISPTRFMKE